MMLALAILCAFGKIMVAGAQSAGPIIVSPTADQALQGQVTISGTADTANFASAELAFAFASDGTDTWFLIQALDQPARDSALATWDTTNITDGPYVLRIRVRTLAGLFQDAQVPIRVANYSTSAVPLPPAIATQRAFLQIATAIVLPASETRAVRLPVTPTSLPGNPASIGNAAIYAGLWRGGVLALMAFLVLAVVLLRRSS